MKKTLESLKYKGLKAIADATAMLKNLFIIFSSIFLFLQAEAGYKMHIRRTTATRG